MKLLRLAATAFALGAMTLVTAQDRAITLEELRSGSAFLGSDLRALQADDFANPGMLWVERGEKLWNAPVGKSGRSCASCHADARASMRTVAASYPKIDARSGELLNVEDRINQCRSERQQAAPLAEESGQLLSLSAYVRRVAVNQKINVVIDGPAQPHFEAGRALYYRRMGQINLSCAQCHEANWGKTLFAETISQGHPNAYPAYRMEWQALGSLDRRLRACLSGVRAEMYPFGAREYRDLELFLMWRAQGLAVEAPGVRR